MTAKNRTITNWMLDNCRDYKRTTGMGRFMDVRGLAYAAAGEFDYPCSETEIMPPPADLLELAQQVCEWEGRTAS